MDNLQSLQTMEDRWACTEKSDWPREGGEGTQSRDRGLGATRHVIPRPWLRFWKSPTPALADDGGLRGTGEGEGRAVRTGDFRTADTPVRVCDDKPASSCVVAGGAPSGVRLCQLRARVTRSPCAGQF